ncbi:MAG: hypothetical protein DMG46_04900 [Acidobacteria bacterium]|nr:MAG: hypothetical protein DMG46_04900 [Acidobacteriota bacterium]
MQETGFLETAASRTADITLLLEMGMGAGLFAGAWLARAGRIRYHAACQAVIVLLNLALIGWTMLPAFRGQVLPQLPGRIGRPHYALAAAHASLGSIVEFAGLYILLAAGTKILPEKLRIKRYRLWMRSVLAAWWVVLFLGIVTYARWYVRWP